MAMNLPPNRDANPQGGIMRIRTIALAGLAGAAAAYLFDPIAGNARRSRLRERVAAAYSQRGRIPADSREPLPDNMIPVPKTETGEMPEEPSKESVPDMPEGPSKENLPDMPEEPSTESAPDAPEDDSMDDAAIADRIRMDVLGRPDLETGSLVVDVVQGAAFLRGELNDRRAIEEIVDLTGSVPGVRSVQNLIVIRMPDSGTVTRPVTKSLGDAWIG
jgi:hypothetical protein